MKASSSVLAALAAQACGVLAESCYSFPGDASWPSEASWATLNTTTGGKLIAASPIGSPCHDPTYDEAACTALQNSWTNPATHLPSSSSVMQAFFANQSCDPFTPREQPCLLGNYARYAIEVTTVDDIKAGLSFAQENNVRFLVRNTGHDFLGRSTGAGALSVWTHKLKDIDFISDYADEFYQGTAVKVGAGVLGYEAIEASAKVNQILVSGECSSVGVAGEIPGYTAGGGHSALSTNFGLAADQTLSFEVVTAAGDLVTASRTENSDLYWAMSGGGVGYGIVVSLTVKTYPDAPVGGGTLQFASSYTTPDKFYEAVSTFHELLPAMVDNGTMIVFYFNSAFFIINPITAYNQTSAQIEAILAPFVAKLNELAIPYSHSYSESPSYREHYNTYMGPLPYGNILVEEYQFASRLIPRDVIETNNAQVQVALRNITEHGVLLLGVATDVSSPGNVDNAVLPAWRNALIHATLTTSWNSSATAWEAMIADQVALTNHLTPQLTALTPGSGSYMNEADFNQPDFQDAFFGANYDALLKIKQKWDPNSVFYAVATVGSEIWSFTKEGRMCRS
ncbi:hypothetical protein HYFRA_00000333 [Hymenoscyphus fraxineus]|uniref:FAD-binding PCMH-type domain-containing protein n=1 Tax=Hymenoscyphus fraxineus TaxID=746836 RepID=A0A9N9L5A3_9HELO|nr:hypothetical protein HYFRA_00000333 [Hymenoscyphus fraxineus]